MNKESTTYILCTGCGTPLAKDNVSALHVYCKSCKSALALVSGMMNRSDGNVYIYQEHPYQSMLYTIVIYPELPIIQLHVYKSPMAPKR